MTRALDDDTGASEVIAVIAFAPVVIAFVVLVFFFGRQVDSRAAVRSAAEAAAQAAAHQRSATAADSAARMVVDDMLTADNAICAGGPRVSLDLGSFRPGGIVAVTVECDLDRSDLGALGPPQRTFIGRASAVVDTYRAGPLP